MRVYEPADAWSVSNLLSDHGESALDPTEATSVAQSGLLRIHCRHTCAHRVNELLSIHNELMQVQPLTELPA